MDITDDRKSMSKQEYADSIGVTRSTVNNWIKRNPKLRRELKLAGLKKNAKLFTKKHLQILEKYLG